MTFNNIVFSINNTYAPYLYVCLKSLLAHIKTYDKYKAYILYTELSERHQENILKLQTDNLKIEFINVETIISKYKDNFSINNHFTIETYYRFFLPHIFLKIDKVLYLDADTMVMTDIKPLFQIDLGDNYLAVTHDCEIVRMSNLAGTEYSDYFTETLGVKIENYFQAGVMIVNLAKMRQDNITDKLLSAQKKIGTPKFVDQDILNMVCQNKVLFIPQNWNYTWHLPFCDLNYSEHLSVFIRDAYKKAQNNPYIIHFTGNKMKPIDYPYAPYADIFWKYVQNTPYNSQLITDREQSIIRNQIIKDKISKKIQKYKLLNILSLGLLKNKYYKKIKKREKDLNIIKKYTEKGPIELKE